MTSFACIVKYWITLSLSYCQSNKLQLFQDIFTERNNCVFVPFRSYISWWEFCHTAGKMTYVWTRWKYFKKKEGFILWKYLKGNWNCTTRLWGFYLSLEFSIMLRIGIFQFFLFKCFTVIYMYFFFEFQIPTLVAKQGKFKTFLEEKCPILKEVFAPTIWCFDARLQTIIQTFIRPISSMNAQR